MTLVESAHRPHGCRACSGSLDFLCYVSLSVWPCGVKKTACLSCVSPLVSAFAHRAIFEVQSHSNNFICLLFFPVFVREQKGGLAQDGGLEQLKSTIYSVESTVVWGKEKVNGEV